MRSSHPQSPIDHPSNGSKGQILVNSRASFYIIIIFSFFLCYKREIHRADHRLHPIVIIKKSQVTYGFCSQIISYIFNMLICLYIILLDNLLQYLLFIDMIDLSRIYDTSSLICYALVMFMIYP
jgi:hypothetical protein